jgi:hypothetical protein
MPFVLPIHLGKGSSLQDLGGNAMPEISDAYWENFVAIVVAFVVLALIIERALYQVFDTKLWTKVEETLDRQAGGDFMDLKPWIAVVVSIVIVFSFKLDMIAMIYKADKPHAISLIITGLFIAGGSTGIYKFFKRARKLKEAISQQEIAKAQVSGP